MSWNKGKTAKDDPRIAHGTRHGLHKGHTIESRAKMSVSQKERFKRETVWNKGKTGYHTSRLGQKHSQETRKKMSEKRKAYFRTHHPWNKGLTKESDKRVQNASKNMSIAKKRNWDDPEFSKHMSEVHKGQIGHAYTTSDLEKRREKARLHSEAVINELKKFEGEGFRVIPTDVKGFPKPDFIILDNERIYAVEVELKTPTRVKMSKYRDFHHFDDIIWVVKET